MTASVLEARRARAEQLTIDGAAVAVYPDPGTDAVRERRAGYTPVRWSRLHAARLGAAGWAVGTLLGLTYVLLPLGPTLDLPLDRVAAGWSFGAAAGTALGALLGGLLGGLLLTVRRWRATR